MGQEKDNNPWRIETTQLGVGGELHRLIIGQERRATTAPAAKRC
jgi:hypothetical protein